jgi:hypothetical protein
MAYAVTALAALVIGAVVVSLNQEPGGRVAERPRPMAPPGRLALAADPYVGIACGIPNDIACDRVGIAVTLEKPAATVTATINGQALTLRLPCGARPYNETCASYCRRAVCGTSFEGFLQPAGLLDGPLEVTPDRGRYFWMGSHPKYPLVRLSATYRNGTRATATRRVWLHAGWG